MFGRSENDPYRLYLPIYSFNMVQNYKYWKIRTSSDILNIDNRVEFLLLFFSGSENVLLGNVDVCVSVLILDTNAHRRVSSILFSNKKMS